METKPSFHLVCCQCLFITYGSFDNNYSSSYVVLNDGTISRFEGSGYITIPAFAWRA
jgi:hypothetical protein